jgi:hypothetical protein
VNEQLQVSADQLEEMRHTLGLNYEKKPFRNRFYTEADDSNWNDLVSKGLARKLKGWEEDMAYFKLTMEGIKIAYGKDVTMEQYKDL